MARPGGRRSHVYVPLVAAGGGAARLTELYAERVPGSDEAGLDPALRQELLRTDREAVRAGLDLVAAPLLGHGGSLYNSGREAVAAVQKLALPLPRLALWQRLRPSAALARQRLRLGAGERPSEGGSAGLGLALALLANLADRPVGRLIATGALARTARSRQDTDLVPVAGLAAKMALVADLAARGLLPEGEGAVRMLVPMTVREGTAERPDTLAEAVALRAAGVELLPVASLAEAAGRLGLDHAALLPADRLAGAGLLLALLAALLGSGFWLVRAMPLAMAFEGEPFQVCEAPEARPFARPLAADGLERIAAVGGSLGWEIRAGDPTSLADRLAGWLHPDGLYLLRIVVARHSLKVHAGGEDGQPALRVPVGGLLRWQTPLEPPAEQHALVLLARRDGPFDAALVESRLRTALGPPPYDVARAVNLARAMAPGSLSFPFSTREGRDPCA